jgi:hypothetical protein
LHILLTRMLMWRLPLKTKLRGEASNFPDPLLLESNLLARKPSLFLEHS